MQRDTDAIVFNNVEKYFYRHNQRTVKELFQALYKKQKTREQVHALNNLSFTIKKGDTIGVVGRNGAGKSTLLKLIAKVSEPTSGNVSVYGHVSPLIELGAGFHPELTGRENIFLNGVILGLKESVIKERYDEIVGFSEIKEFIDMPVKHYSSGMYMRLAFSVAVFTNPEILIIDEILAVGDDAFKKKCMKKMNEFKKKGITIIFVSHDLEVLKSFCTRVLYLNQGKLQFDGAVDEVVKLYANL